MSSTTFAENISTITTDIVTKVMTWLQDTMWNAAKINAKIWTWMPTWLEITLIIISISILAYLMKYAWDNREFWQDLIEGKI